MSRGLKKVLALAAMAAMAAAGVVACEKQEERGPDVLVMVNGDAIRTRDLQRAWLALGPDHRLLLPASALAGAVFLVIADMIARTVLAPTEIPVGVFTALVGAPFFIYLLRRTRREYAF